MKEKVMLGSVVTIFDKGVNELATYKLVARERKNEQELSYMSALGKALCGREENDCVIVESDVPYEVVILKVLNASKSANSCNRNVFFVFQGKQFYHEYSAGYIFAGKDESISHWRRLKDVKKGDIILHSDAQHIVAIGVAKSEYYTSYRPKSHLLANDRDDQTGWMVDVEYFLLDYPLNTSIYKNEIVKLQGENTGQGYPFNKNGSGNQGYLFNLNKALTRFFMEKITKKNPSLLNMDYVQDVLGVGNPNPNGDAKWLVTNERMTCRGKNGFRIYNPNGENIGIVFMTDDVRLESYGYCEIAVFPEYQNKYGAWHRIRSNGGRIQWKQLCLVLAQQGKYSAVIDDWR